MPVMQEQDYYMFIIYSSTEVGSQHIENFQRVKWIGLADLKSLN